MENLKSRQRKSDRARLWEVVDYEKFYLSAFGWESFGEHFV